MTASMLFPAGAGTGLVGLVLLVLECTRALSDNVLGSVGVVLLWVGVGLVVLSGLILLFVVSDRGQPTDG